MKAPELRLYRNTDREAVLGLLKRCFLTDEAFLRFEHGNPHGEPLRVVATLNDRIVGFNHWQPWKIPGVEATVFQSGASAVDPTTRGLGIFAKLLGAGEEEARARRVSCFIGFPNPASLGSFLRAGWTHFASMPLYLALRPALSRSCSLAAATEVPAFFEWRYGAAAADRRIVALPGGRRVHAFFRAERRLGVSTVRVLDVLSEAGERDLTALSGIVPTLPGPGPVLVRCSHAGAPSLSIRLRRKWETPVILRSVCDEAEAEAALRRATFTNGDIDAA